MGHYDSAYEYDDEMARKYGPGWRYSKKYLADTALPKEEGWIVDPYTFEIMTVAAFDEKESQQVVHRIGSFKQTRGSLGMSGAGHRVLAKIKTHKTKKEAEDAKAKMLAESIKKAEEKLERLK